MNIKCPNRFGERSDIILKPLKPDLADFFQIDNLLDKDEFLIVEPLQIDFFGHNIDIRYVEGD